MISKFIPNLEGNEVKYLLILDILRETLEKYELKKMPTENTLHACLENYTKEKLFNLAYDNGIEIKKSWKKAKLVEYIYNELMDTMEERLLLLGEKNIKPLQDLKNHKFASDNFVDEENNFYLEVYKKAVRMGLLYSLNNEGEFISLMPAEVEKALMEVSTNMNQMKKEYQSEMTIWNQLEEVIVAGVHLYGTVSSSRILKLWEIRYPDPECTTEGIVDFTRTISKIIPLLAIRNDYYFVDRYIIGSDQFASDEDAANYYYSVHNKMNVDYYEPTKEDIQYYAKHSFDRRTPVYKRLKQFVSRNTKQVDLVMDLVEFNIQMDYSSSDLVEEISASNLLQFDTDRQVGQFLSLYTQLNNNTRLWDNAGYTPSELFKPKRTEVDWINESNPYDLAEEKNAQENIIPMRSYRKTENKKQKPKTVKKIGRNEPCPCGSGKKYKKCCMRKER